MAELTTYASIPYQGIEARAIPRFRSTPTGGGGLGVAGVAVPSTGQAYELTITCFCTTSSAATNMRTFLLTLMDGTTFTVANSGDGGDGGTYTCRLDPDTPIGSTYVTANRWEWTLNARGTRA